MWIVFQKYLPFLNKFKKLKILQTSFRSFFETNFQIVCGNDGYDTLLESHRLAQTMVYRTHFQIRYCLRGVFKTSFFVGTAALHTNYPIGLAN